MTRRGTRPDPRLERGPPERGPPGRSPLESVPSVRIVSGSGGPVSLSPPVLLALVYLTAIVVGAGLLMLPFAQAQPVTLFEALFTAVSATCVTGLTIVPTGASYTGFGQAVLMVQMQLGGVGLIVAATLIISALGGKIGPMGRNALKEELGRTSIARVKDITLRIMVLVIALELTGAVLFAFAFVPELGWAEGLWFSLFHAISAFNNAGFDLTDTSFRDYATSAPVLIAASLLIIVGGLGWGVVVDLWDAQRWRDLGLHTRLTLTGTAILLAGGALVLGLVEWNNAETIGAAPLGERITTAVFQSITARTAGFSTVDIGALSDEAALVMMLLMFIGAGAASTAGGIKVATFMVAMLATISFYRRRREIQIFSRRLDFTNIVKVLAVIMSGALVVIAGTFALTVVAQGDFLDLAFEAVSAFGTVGLSRGVTTEIGQPGQTVLMVLMMLGRIGPITLGYFLLVPRSRIVHYPRGRIFLG
ncbi:MAG: hypothetical protein MK010_08185 [Erythrobacter sp.]|nr:hypothetical protein [Erythrobacter sp.]